MEKLLLAAEAPFVSNGTRVTHGSEGTSQGGAMTRVRALGGVLVLGILLFAPMSAQAASIQIQGNAQACFGDGCTFSENASTTIGGATLSFYSNSLYDFLGYTADDVLAINGAAGNNFGMLSVTTSAKQAVSTAFSLLLTFINPTSPTATFEAAIRGTVTTNPLTGGVFVMFDPYVVTVPFSDAATGQSGTMNIYANNASLTNGTFTGLSGFIETEAVPEPATLMLLGVGFAGLVARRKKLLRQV